MHYTQPFSVIKATLRITYLLGLTFADDFLWVTLQH